MSYPVTSQPQCASSSYQTQLSDWHTGLTDCCNDMPVCECPPLPLQAQGMWRGARSPPTPPDALLTPLTPFPTLPWTLNSPSLTPSSDLQHALGS